MKENKNFSDFNLINNFMLNLNFTKYRFNNNNTFEKQLGGNGDDILQLPSMTYSSLPPPSMPLYEIPSSGMPTPSMIPSGMPSPSMISSGMPTPSMVPSGIPSSGMPTPSMIPSGMPISEMPSGMPISEMPSGMPISGMPPSEMPSGMPISGMPSPSMTLSGMPVSGMPVSGMPTLEKDELIIPEVEELTDEIEEYGQTQLKMGITDDEDCVYKKIRNEDGTVVTQKICGQKIITMPDMFLPKPTFMYSGTNTYTIKKGTILYHGTVNKRGFNTKEIKLGKDKLISFFTPNFRLASDKIEGCSIDKQKGFIHVFEVKKDIPDIYIKLPYDTDEELNLDELKDKFCNGNQYYKGVGFFYPKNEIEIFNNSVLNQQILQMHENLDDESYYSEFALCLPSEYLGYLYSQKCMSLRRLSDPYTFDGKKYK
jgi:hypothetical protein